MEKNTALANVRGIERDIHRLTYDLREAIVSAVLDGGATWPEIGAALGISKQTAHARYGQDVRVERGSRTWAEENPERHAAAVARGKAAAAKDLDEIRARVWTSTPKISDTDVAGESETPSIFSDTPAPAKARAEAIHGTRTVEVFTEFAANQPKRNADPRQHGRIIEEPYEGMARPGTGKGPQVCKGCGSNNHHGTERGQVYWNDGCKPTKYDTAEETEFLNLVYKEASK